MPEPIGLDEGGYDALYQALVQGVSARTPGWTDAYAASPTVTFAETMAWLIDMQRFYIDRITEEHRLCLLRLLGGRLTAARAAHGVMRLDSAGRCGVLPRGTLFYAGEIPFETEAALTLCGEAALVPVTQCRTEATCEADYGGADWEALSWQGGVCRVRRCAEPTVWQTDGAAGQIIQLEKDVLPAGLRLLVAEGETGWRELPVDPPARPDQPTGPGCRYDPLRHALVLGDGRDFLIPPARRHGLRPLVLRRSLGAAGNLQAGAALTGADGARGTLVKDACGGRNAGTVREALQARLKALEQPLRAVTAADIERLLLRAPGAAVRRARAYEAADHTVCAVVEAVNGAVDVERVRRYLAPRMVLGTRVQISAPRVLTVDLRMCVAAGTSAQKQALRQAAGDWIARTPIGGTLEQAALVHALEAAGGVERIDAVAITPRDGALGRAYGGRVETAPDVVCRLGACEIEEG